jgi:ATP-binding cassette, subfamily C (CFTR/MRP), member 1
MESRTQELRLDKNWELYKNSSKLPILKALVQTYKGEFVFSFVVNFLVVLWSISSPILISLIVTYLETPIGEDGGVWLGIAYLSIFIFLGTAGKLLYEQASYRQDILGNKALASLVTKIYNRTLKISSSTNKHFSQGEIINFIQVDSEKVCSLWWEFPTVARLPIQLLFGMTYLFYHLKYFVFFGLIISAFMFIINYYLAICNAQICGRMMKQRDERINTITELISSMKIIKINSWIKYFIEKVRLQRKRELWEVRFTLVAYSLEEFTAFILVPFMIIVSVGLFFLWGNTMSLGNVFGCITVFYSIDEPIRWIPNFIGNLMEFLVSMKRIQKFLLWDEINSKLIEECNQDLKQQNVDILINHSNFTWGGKKKMSEDNNDQKKLDRVKENEMNLTGKICPIKCQFLIYNRWTNLKLSISINHLIDISHQSITL